MCQQFGSWRTWRPVTKRSEFYGLGAALMQCVCVRVCVNACPNYYHMCAGCRVRNSTFRTRYNMRHDETHARPGDIRKMLRTDMDIAMLVGIGMPVRKKNARTAPRRGLLVKRVKSACSGILAILSRAHAHAHILHNSRNMRARIRQAPNRIDGIAASKPIFNNQLPLTMCRCVRACGCVSLRAFVLCNVRFLRVHKLCALTMYHLLVATIGVRPEPTDACRTGRTNIIISWCSYARTPISDANRVFGHRTHLTREFVCFLRACT